MSMLKDIADFLEDQGIGTVAADIFYSKMPDQPNDLVCLHEYAGEPPLLREQLDRPGLQVACRGSGHEPVRAKLQNIQNLLMRIGYELDENFSEGVVVNGTPYLRITPAQGAQPAEADGNGRMTIRQNFNVLKRR